MWRNIFRRSHRIALGPLCTQIIAEQTIWLKPNYLEASKELYMQQNKNGILFSYICSFKKGKRERNRADGVKLVTGQLTHILSALCMRLNCFRVCCCWNIPEMNQKSSCFHPWPDLWHTHTHTHTHMYTHMHTRVHTPVCILRSPLQLLCHSIGVYRGPHGASLCPFGWVQFLRKESYRKRELKVPCVMCN